MYIGFMEIVQDNKSLIKACKLIRKQSVIYIDTEFLRDKTYWPVLCLIQIKTARKIFAIDTLSPKKMNFSCLREILEEKKIIKVMHACKQDLEVLMLKFDVFVQPIFDTQLAYYQLTKQDNIGYTNLVKRLLDVDLNKDHQVSNWSLRPLLAKQIEYAANDVRYLPNLYKNLNKNIRRKKMVKSFNAKLKRLDSVKNIYNIEDSWQKIKILKKNNLDIRLLKKFSKWREENAQTKNLPRNWIITDKIIIKAAKKKIQADEKKENMKNIRLNSYLNEFLDYLKINKLV